MEAATTDPKAFIAISVITAVTTIIVAIINKHVVRKIKFRPPNDYAGYERLIEHIDEDLRKSREKIEELQNTLDAVKEQLIIEKDKNKAMRNKLLEISQNFGVDVSSVV